MNDNASSEIKNHITISDHSDQYHVKGQNDFFSSPGTNVLGEVLSYPRRRRRRCRCRCRCRCRRRQFQVKVFVY